MEYKICKKCGIEKELTKEFFFRKGPGFRRECKVCMKEYNKKYQEENREEICKNKKEYEIKNRDKRMSYLQKNKEKRKENRQKNKKERNQKQKIRFNSDPIFRLRASCSVMIGKFLKSIGSKKDSSILKFLPYSIEELKSHLEKQFEPWMTWDNQGKYDPKTWDDTISTTWTWQLDHIIPQADLPYTSMTEENFKKCWVLENLRPYSAKQNSIDGASKIRHKKS